MLTHIMMTRPKTKFTNGDDVNVDHHHNIQDPSNVKVVNNKIYFYEDVTIESTLLLCTHVKDLEKKFLKLQIDYDLKKPPKIYIYIHSYGGDVYAGLSCMNTLENCNVPIITIVDGYVASAATFLLLGGHKRHMRKYSHILIHQIRGESWGKYEELKDEFINTEKLMETIKNIYLTKSNNDLISHPNRYCF